MVLGALDSFPKAQAWILPADVPPLAGQTTHKNPGLSFDDRVALCEAAFVASLNAKYQARVKICRFEQDLPKPNFTAQTLSYLTKELPQQNFAFLVGQDQLANFPKWHLPHKVLSHVALVACQRHGHPEPLKTTLLRTVERLGGDVKVKHGDHYLASFHDYEQRLYPLDLTVSAAASEDIRGAITKGEPYQHWLTDQVTSIITANNLYRG